MLTSQEYWLAFVDLYCLYFHRRPRCDIDADLCQFLGLAFQRMNQDVELILRASRELSSHDALFKLDESRLQRFRLLVQIYFNHLFPEQVEPSAKKLYLAGILPRGDLLQRNKPGGDICYHHGRSVVHYQWLRGINVVDFIIGESYCVSPRLSRYSLAPGTLLVLHRLDFSLCLARVSAPQLLLKVQLLARINT